VGSVTPRKGFLDVAAVLARRAERDYVWRVVGSLDADPDYAERLARMTRALTGVVLEGQKTPSEVQRIVRACDALVMPSYDENQPLVLVEAMAASVPAVAYSAGAARHMLEHRRQGFIVPIGDTQGLAEHINRLIDDEELRHALAVECWKRQSSIPDWPVAAQLATQALHAGWSALQA
jgi:glycosyltransferase involved in cell wall biosynthesis